MTRTPWYAGLAGSALLSTALVTAALAQPPGPPPGPPEGGPPHGPRDPLRAALDANHDFVIDADEIAKAPEAIKTLDKNGDGTLDREELRPPMGPPRGGPGAWGRGPHRPGEFGGRPPRDSESGRPPREGREGPPPPDRDSSDDHPRPRRERESADDSPPPRRESRSGDSAGERPSPERFVRRAMEFDADGDGTLDERELRKMARMMAERMRDARGPGGPPRDGGERPERPRRPE